MPHITHRTLPSTYPRSGIILSTDADHGVGRPLAYTSIERPVRPHKPPCLSNISFRYSVVRLNGTLNLSARLRQFCHVMNGKFNWFLLRCASKWHCLHSLRGYCLSGFLFIEYWSRFFSCLQILQAFSPCNERSASSSILVMKTSACSFVYWRFRIVLANLQQRMHSFRLLPSFLT